MKTETSTIYRQVLTKFFRRLLRDEYEVPPKKQFYVIADPDHVGIVENHMYGLSFTRCPLLPSATWAMDSEERTIESCPAPKNWVGV